MKGSQWGAIFILIIAFIIAGITRSGSQPGTKSYIESQKQGIIQVVDNQFCLKLARKISGTVEYKDSIYQDCKED